MPIESAVSDWVARSIELFSPITAPTVAGRRSMIEAAYIRLMGEAPFLSEGAPTTGSFEVTVPGPHRSIPIRVIVPPGEHPRPVVMHLFGGAWWQRSFNAPDVLSACEHLAVAADVIVVQVDYALAPEHPYPEALDEAGAVLTWLAGGQAPDAARVDPTRLVVGGISSGANLAAALCLRVRDRGGPSILLQVLEVPVLDLTLGHYDDGAHAAFPVVDGSEPASRVPLEEAVEFYLGSRSRTDPYVSPLLAADLRDLPPALILTAEYDPLWVEGVAYGAALTAAGNSATVATYSGLTHAAPSLSAISAGSRAWRDQVADAVRRAVHG